MKYPVTPATKLLDETGTEYTKHLYDYRKSGAVVAAHQMELDEHTVVKTLVMEDDTGNPLIVLMHGEKEVSLKELARQVGAKNVRTTSRKDAQRYTGYTVGGISPFGTKRELPVYVQSTIMELPYLYINAGRRGFIVGMKPETLQRVLRPQPVDVSR
ncbi:Cys-tRNA(Pro) deacylase [Candidatus Bathyarchaeota archaeon]|nr:Cys-tRNA(Pro) deacylase [Candidatus Bathyarchaeota archaeon]